MKKKSIYISNLSWRHEDFTSIIKLIKTHKISGVDIAPIKIFKNWKNVEKKVKKFNKILRKNKIKVNAIQGVFFKTNLNLFDNVNKNFEKIENHLKLVLRVAKVFGCNKIIIGSTEFRNKKKISKVYSDKIFINFFSKFKKILKKNKIYFCMETIPKQYNEKYIFKLEHLLYLIKKINSKYIKINFDTSLFHYNNSNFLNLRQNLDQIKTFQFTEKNFDYFLNPSKNNLKIAKMIKNSNKVNEISLEIIKKKTNIKYLSKSIINLKNLLN